MLIKRGVFILLVMLLIVPAVPAQYRDIDAMVDILEQGSRSITVGDLLMDEQFDEPGNWDVYTGSNGLVGIEDGAYLMTTNQADLTLYARDATTDYDNVVMVVDTVQRSTENDNAFGMTCRGSNEVLIPTGYYFYISGDGFALIGIHNGIGFTTLADWTPVSAINQGQELNRVMIVCVDDYLAIYANGELAIETTDTTLTSGTVGFTILNYVETIDLEIVYDNLEVYSASGDGTSASSDASATVVTLDADLSKSALAQAISNLDASGSEIQAGTVVLTSTFEADEDGENWEILDLDNEAGIFRSSVIDERYVIYSASAEAGSNQWAINQQILITDGIVMATAEQLSSEEDNGYGIVCRVNVGLYADGYFFSISGDGFYSISRFQDGESEALHPWTASDVINMGQGATNDLMAVCVDDYLAFYVNGELLAEVSDDVFTAGAIGATVDTFVDGEPTEIAFDNFVLIEASR